MVSVVWDFGVFPFVPGNWEAGLVIRTLGFEGQWPDVAIALRPRLPSLRALCCRGIGLERLDLSQAPGLNWLNCDNNNLSELDLSPVPGLTKLWADEGLQLRNIPAGLEVNPNYPEFLRLDQR